MGSCLSRVLDAGPRCAREREGNSGCLGKHRESNVLIPRARRPYVNINGGVLSEHFVSLVRLEALKVRVRHWERIP